jgi:uncharacterized membrane protein
VRVLVYKGDVKNRAPQRHKVEPVATPRRDWLLSAVAGFGVVILGYLAAMKLSGGSAVFCTAGSGCDVVQASRYATFLWVPTAAWGTLFFAAIGALGLWGLSAERWQWAFLLSVAGAAFSLYMSYLAAFEVRAFCAYCGASTLVALALFGIVLARRPAGGGKRSPTRPARLAALGAVTAIVTIVFGAGVYASYSSQGSTPFQEALARHLAQTGAVFYGAYW